MLNRREKQAARLMAQYFEGRGDRRKIARVMYITFDEEEREDLRALALRTIKRIENSKEQS
jgi:hypothetical protein